MVETYAQVVAQSFGFAMVGQVPSRAGAIVIGDEGQNTRPGLVGIIGYFQLHPRVQVLRPSHFPLKLTLQKVVVLEKLEGGTVVVAAADVKFPAVVYLPTVAKRQIFPFAGLVIELRFEQVVAYPLTRCGDPVTEVFLGVERPGTPDGLLQIGQITYVGAAQDAHLGVEEAVVSAEGPPGRKELRYL